jgi:hypothetical protein
VSAKAAFRLKLGHLLKGLVFFRSSEVDRDLATWASPNNFELILI